MIPKIRVWPEAISAYTPPVSTPRTTPWIRACIRRSPAPVRLRVDRRRGGEVGRVDRDQLAALPLHEVEAAARRAGGVPAQVAQQGRPGSLVEGRDDGRVVDLPGLLGDSLQELAGRVRLG